MVGFGATAHVFAARYGSKLVAAKRLPCPSGWAAADRVRALASEAHALAQLRHPHIVQARRRRRGQPRTVVVRWMLSFFLSFFLSFYELSSFHLSSFRFILFAFISVWLLVVRLAVCWHAAQFAVVLSFF